MVMHFCVPAHHLACFFQRGSGWTQTGFPREGFGVRRCSLFILQLRILGLSDHRVQIACALLLRRARSIRSLPQDAIGRTVLTLIVFLWEANSSSYGASTWASCHTDRLRKFTGYTTVLYPPIQRRVSRYDVCKKNG
jgi:hypothetical protein